MVCGAIYLAVVLGVSGYVVAVYFGGVEGYAGFGVQVGLEAQVWGLSWVEKVNCEATGV